MRFYDFSHLVPDHLSPRQRLDLLLSIFLGVTTLLITFFVSAYRNTPGLSRSDASLYSLSWGLAFASCAMTLSWLIVRPEPPGSQDRTYHLTDPPTWFVVLRPVVFVSVVWMSPMGWWALLWLTVAWVAVFALSLPMRRAVGSHVGFVDTLRHVAERGGHVCPTCGVDLPIRSLGTQAVTCLKCRKSFTREQLLDNWGLSSSGKD
jgi:vacuolar-type H+-ATPase subunit I/STV1